MLMWREDKELSKYSRSKAKMDLTKIGQVVSVLALLARSLGFCWGDYTHSCPLTCACIGFAGICHGSTGSPSALSEEDSKGGVTVLEGSKVLARGTRSCT